MASRHVTLCDQIVEHLNDSTQQAGYVCEFTADRINIPRYDLENVTGLQVIVFPGPRLPEKIGRDTWLKTYSVFVLLAQKVSGNTDWSERERQDELIELAEQIENSLWDQTFLGMGSIPLEGVEFPPFIEDWLKQDDVFVQILEVAYAEAITSGS